MDHSVRFTMTAAVQRAILALPKPPGPTVLVDGTLRDIVNDSSQRSGR